MTEREFDITIAGDGMVQVHVKGFKGRSCMEAIKLFEKIIGELKSEQKTSEFYQPEEQVQFHIEQKQ